MLATLFVELYVNVSLDHRFLYVSVFEWTGTHCLGATLFVLKYTVRGSAVVAYYSSAMVQA